MRAPLGPTQSVLIRRVSLFRGLFDTCKIRLGLHAMSALQWMSLFQGCLLGGVPLYMYNVIRVPIWQKVLSSLYNKQTGELQ